MTDSDTYWHAGPLENSRLYCPCKVAERFSDSSQVCETFIDVKERRTAMDMTSAQTFRYSISDVGCP
ncbi:hypothetical protein, partial [Pseudomonas sp. 165]|uniref:hypothetical protein n=1 Tax=Pseudomonas sp. 165 TaxID=2746722 RepID=UPI002577EE33